MSRVETNNPAPFGDVSTPAPSARLWAIGAGAAVAAHALAALPFLPEPVAPAAVDLDQGPALGVRLAPLVTPPEAPPPDPVPEVEEQVIEERAFDSPPPAPPARPRELPDLPDISPRAVPDLWRGDGSGGGITLEEYLALKDWLNAVRTAILKNLSYPREARERGLTGSAQVIVLANRDGRIVQWSFRRQTGHALLDREIKRSIDGIRRLPRFPEGTQYDELSFSVPIRFALVYGAGDAPPPASTAQADGQSGAQAGAGAPAADNTLPVAQLRYCAGAAATLDANRTAVEARKLELEAMASEYERSIDRYERRRQEPPRRVLRMREEYESGIDAFNASVAAYQREAQAFSSVCGGGSATFENYAIACGPYVAGGNIYCEAYGDLWMRLRAGAR